MNVVKIKRLLLLTIFVMTAIMAYYIWLYNTQDVKIVEPEPVNLETSADVWVSDVELTETTGEHILWTLRAKTAEVYSARKETQLKDIEVDFFDKDGSKSMHLVSDYGFKDDNSGNITASGNVQATSYKEGATLKTDELVYDANANLITSDKYVVIQQGNTIISGEGLESDLSLSNVRILRNITTSVAEPE